MFFHQRKEVVIIGCSNMGATIAAYLCNRGDNVTIIDKSTEAFSKLHFTFSGFQTEGDAANIKILKEAKCDKADVVLVSTDKDTVNSMVGQMAKVILNVKEVIVRLDDDDYDEILKPLGIKIIHPSKLSLDAFLEITKDGDML